MATYEMSKRPNIRYVGTFKFSMEILLHLIRRGDYEAVELRVERLKVLTKIMLE
jgi:hypothetical protein